jgi:hypothetical protein
MAFDLRPELLHCRYRSARSNYTLVPYHELSPSQQDLLHALRRDPDFFGVLLPNQGDGRGIQCVSRETAALFEALTQPRGLSPQEDAGPEHRARLVLDGVLELEWNGGFHTGPAAHEAVFEHVSPTAADEIGRLSWDALRYGETLDDHDPRSLSERLYRFNSIPATPEWRRRLGTTDEVMTYLCLGPGQDVAIGFEAAGLKPSGATGPWISWHHRRATDAPGFKLYVSPLPRHLPQALRAVAGLAGTAELESVKVGRDLHGLLRPDKLVLYFSDREPLLSMAQRLEKVLSGVAAQGVPFTAQLGSGGLLSWGADPGDARRIGTSSGAESWRSWVTKRLALGLLAARSADAPVSPSRFSVDRLALEGVDLTSWSPTEDYLSTVMEAPMIAHAAD